MQDTGQRFAILRVCGSSDPLPPKAAGELPCRRLATEHTGYAGVPVGFPEERAAKRRRSLRRS